MIIRSFTIFGVLLLGGFVVGQPQFEVEQGHLKLLKPESPPAGVNSSFDTGIADFGTPLYGGTQVGVLVWDKNSPGLCEAVDQNTKNLWQQQSKQSNSNFIVLIERGTCLFADKTFNAQEAGAVAAVIYDNKDEGILTMASPSNEAAAEQARKIEIPTVFVSLNSGNQLLSLLNTSNAETVVVQLDWTGNLLGGSDERVEWDFWFSTDPSCGPSCTRTKDFIISFAPQAKQLLADNKTFFTPHTVFRPCLDAPGSDACNDCIKGGQYCAYESNPNIQEPYAVPEENLRSLCVYQTLLAQNQASKWWDYTSQVFETCSETFDRECSYRVIDKLQIDSSQVDTCIGDITKKENNEMIENQLLGMLDSNNTGHGKIALVPTLVINNKEQYRGRLDALSVLRAICAGFAEGSDIDMCLAPNVQYSTEDCTKDNGGCWKDDSTNTTACFDTFRGSVCKCPTGWQGDGKTCSDIDECAPGGRGATQCEQGCINKPGSFQCTCNEGYDLLGGSGEKGYCVNAVALQGGQQQSSSKSSDDSSPSTGVVAFIVILVTIVVVAAGIASYHYVYKRRMQKEVRSIVQQYMPLPELPSENELPPAQSPVHKVV